MLNTEKIIDALIEIKNIKKWTNYKIAVKSNLPVSTVSNVFNKKSKPQLDTLFAICRGFGINPAQLFVNAVKCEKLREDEAEIIRLWNMLDNKRQSVIKEIIKSVII